MPEVSAETSGDAIQVIPDQVGKKSPEETNVKQEVVPEEKEALNGPGSVQWKQAMIDELYLFEQSDAWEVVNLPVDSTAVPCKWVFKRKVDSDNNITYRARQVETRQETISSARTSILFSNILTIEEIRNYDIDFNKFSNIKLGVANDDINDSIVLTIKIPTKTIKLNKKLLIPLQHLTKAKSPKELFPNKNCIVKNNCKFIKSAQDKLIEIGNDIVILNNMKKQPLNDFEFDGQIGDVNEDVIRGGHPRLDQNECAA
ncbi:unnamed protein product [Hermetia illucens]|uniref:Reverse transcriptase n=1 Tax=Hermetia illucens TaxID=343691 RepID=A0A7R8UD08_HERIL|nr:unnamed protein product [Hermetia illucens]